MTGTESRLGMGHRGLDEEGSENIPGRGTACAKAPRSPGILPPRGPERGQWPESSKQGLEALELNLWRLVAPARF